MRTLVVGLFDLRGEERPRCVGRTSDPELAELVCRAIREERLQDLKRLDKLYHAAKNPSLLVPHPDDSHAA